MRLPTINSSQASSTTTADAALSVAKRRSVDATNCNPVVLKTTPFLFDTATGTGLAFGDATFHFSDGYTPHLSNLPQMTALRNKDELTPADVSPQTCVPTNLTFPDSEMTPQFVLAPNQSLRNHSSPDGSPLVWKLTPFVLDNPFGGEGHYLIANGTDTVDPASFQGLTVADFPRMLGLRPAAELAPARSSHRPVTYAAPTNAYTLLPVAYVQDTVISFLLSRPTPTSAAPVVQMTATASSAYLSSVATMPPISTALSVSDAGRLPSSMMAGILIGGTAGFLLLAAIGRVAHDKIRTMRKGAQMGGRMKAWAGSRGFELQPIPAATTNRDADV